MTTWVKPLPILLAPSFWHHLLGGRVLDHCTTMPVPLLCVFKTCVWLGLCLFCNCCIPYLSVNFSSGSSTSNPASSSCAWESSGWYAKYVRSRRAMKTHFGLICSSSPMIPVPVRAVPAQPTEPPIPLQKGPWSPFPPSHHHWEMQSHLPQSAAYASDSCALFGLLLFASCLDLHIA